MAYSGLIAPGTSRVGSISPMRDYDTYNTTFIEGLTYSVAAKGVSSGSGTLYDPNISLYNSNGTRVLYNDDINPANDSTPGVNRDGQITFTIGNGWTGTWTLGVGETGNNATGSYTLTVSLGYATNGNDRVVGTGSNDGIHGMDGNDTIYGQGGNDNLVGALGNDQLLGGAGADILNGGYGADVLRGQDGADRLLGGAGADRLIGGANADRFVFNAVSDSSGRTVDVISAGDGATAFQGIGVRGGDVIDLSGIDANVNYAGNQTFGFSASRAAGTVVLSQDSYGNTILSGHVNNDRVADFRLVIQDGSVSPYAYSADEFVL
ncbi:calcium-binding protein [Paracoccus endophyticus]|uniref:calcium-binding protein n=1 Tax=Paracoccus endophyticus TaxID=2233774 RepID=UPI000DD87BE2|nr:calcium-binding protein [Paracoccus endophyticus]